MEKRKRVLLSEFVEDDINGIFDFGIYRFGRTQADQYRRQIMSHILGLSTDFTIYPECRHLPTISQKYRNIILASHLIIYRVTPHTIEVLRILHSSSSIRTIRSTRSVKT